MLAPPDKSGDARLGRQAILNGMTSSRQERPAIVSTAANAEARLALAAHPGFAQAMRQSADGIVRLHRGSHLLNWLVDDRSRMLFSYFALHLHMTRDPADPASGITPTAMKEIAVAQQICSRGRAAVMLQLMRIAGYLAPDPAKTDRRRQRLIATDKLVQLMQERWRFNFGAMAPLFADGPRLVAALDDPAYVAALLGAMHARFSAGFRFLTHAPELGLFAERSGGMVLLTSLITSGEADDTVPPSRPVTASISALARRVSVSRPHMRKLLRDAEAQGFIARVGAGDELIVFRPVLADAARSFFAMMFLMLADCGREALAERARTAGPAPHAAVASGRP
ncbi:hypothetical protein [Phreatobacter stygius]|uniref:Uncharacterized protein n=1 Tax=Phreatobacter stygius TaxID=1940610 RepID=A0A4D7B4L2_9HYPH|nr:hypothetical protein [Phreatobacter stygius]QCI63132.1 hypothetical protein E8M01_02095 [Phreatobacter stygius]